MTTCRHRAEKDLLPPIRRCQVKDNIIIIWINEIMRAIVWRPCLLACVSLGFSRCRESKWEENISRIDRGRKTTLAVQERSRPIAAFEMTWKLHEKTKQKGRRTLRLWWHINPSPWCIHGLLASSPRGVVCKWVPGSALSVGQHSVREGPTKWGAKRSGQVWCHTREDLLPLWRASLLQQTNMFAGFVFAHLHAHGFLSSQSLYHHFFTAPPPPPPVVRLWCSSGFLSDFWGTL